MAHHGLVKKEIHNSFEGWNQSEKLLKKFVDEMCIDPGLPGRVLDITNSNKTKRTLVERGNSVERKTEADLS